MHNPPMRIRSLLAAQKAHTLIHEQSASRKEIRTEAVSYQQAEDHLTEAVLIVCHHFEEPNAHRFRTRRTHHGRLDLDGFFVGGWLDDQLDEGPLRQGLRRLERAASHGDIRHTIVRAYGVLCDKVGSERDRQASVLSAVRRRSLTGGVIPVGMETCGAELAPK